MNPRRVVTFRKVTSFSMPSPAKWCFLEKKICRYCTPILEERDRTYPWEMKLVLLIKGSDDSILTN
jgi:hypothetical protein